jgi:hypothetical protein
MRERLRSGRHGLVENDSRTRRLVMNQRIGHVAVRAHIQPLHLLGLSREFSMSPLLLYRRAGLNEFTDETVRRPIAGPFGGCARFAKGPPGRQPLSFRHSPDCRI